MVVWSFFYLVGRQVWTLRLATPKTALLTEPGKSGARGVAALAVGPDSARGQELATHHYMEGRTVRELMRRLENPAMNSKHADPGQWTLLALTETRWMMLTVLELPWRATVTTSPHVHRFFFKPNTNDPHNLINIEHHLHFH